MIIDDMQNPATPAGDEASGEGADDSGSTTEEQA